MSGSHKGASPDNRKEQSSGKDEAAAKKGRKQRTGDVGRALRSVYDDTLRESVPDDFMDLLGKLS